MPWIVLLLETCINIYSFSHNVNIAVCGNIVCGTLVPTSDLL